MPERRFLNCVALTAACVALGLATAGVYAEDWPQWRGVDRIGVWTDTGIVEQLPDAGLKVTWRVPVRGGFAGPGGRRRSRLCPRLQGDAGQPHHGRHRAPPGAR